MKKSDIFWQSYLNLEKEALNILRVIFYTDEIEINSKSGIKMEDSSAQLNTFSPYIADLLINCCVQIEAISKELYFNLGGTKAKGDSSLLFDSDCLKLIDIAWKTHKKVVLLVSTSVNLKQESNRVLKPLKEAHKKQKTLWTKAYQSLKHDRYHSLKCGSIKAYLHALAALFLLNIYFRDISWNVKFNEIDSIDYSLGSSLFAIHQPSYGGINGIEEETESPYIIRYHDKEYDKIEKLKSKENEAIVEYLQSQPEFKEKQFTEKLKVAMDKNPGNQFAIFRELELYRINKEIPCTLPYETRKKILLNSRQCACYVYQNNKHLNPDEISKENIQDEIDNAGRAYGIETMKQFWAIGPLPYILNHAIYNVHIPSPKLQE